MSELGFSGYYSQVQVTHGDEVPLDLGLMIEDAEVDVEVDAIIEESSYCNPETISFWPIHLITEIGLGLVFLFLLQQGVRGY